MATMRQVLAWLPGSPGDIPHLEHVGDKVALIPNRNPEPHPR